jgi:hypothetical protein
VHWMGDTASFAAWCRQADPDALERALRAVPPIYWPSIRAAVREAIAVDGPFHPRAARFDAVDDAMRETLGEANISPNGQLGLGLG